MNELFCNYYNVPIHCSGLLNYKSCETHWKKETKINFNALINIVSNRFTSIATVKPEIIIIEIPLYGFQFYYGYRYVL